MTMIQTEDEREREIEIIELIISTPTSVLLTPPTKVPLKAIGALLSHYFLKVIPRYGFRI